MIRRGHATITNRERATVLAACAGVMLASLAFGRCGHDPTPADNMSQLQHAREQMSCQNVNADGYSTPACPSGGALP